MTRTDADLSLLLPRAPRSTRGLGDLALIDYIFEADKRRLTGLERARFFRLGIARHELAVRAQEEWNLRHYGTRENAGRLRANKDRARRGNLAVIGELATLAGRLERAAAEEDLESGRLFERGTAVEWNAAGTWTPAEYLEPYHRPGAHVIRTEHLAPFAVEAEDLRPATDDDALILSDVATPETDLAEELAGDLIAEARSAGIASRPSRLAELADRVHGMTPAELDPHAEARRAFRERVELEREDQANDAAREWRADQ